jgi:hypothetical protein
MLVGKGSDPGLVASTHLVLVVGWAAVHFLDLSVCFADPVAAVVAAAVEAHCRLAAEDAGSEAAVSVPDSARMVAAGSMARYMPLPDNTGLAAAVCGPALAGPTSSIR